MEDFLYNYISFDRQVDPTNYRPSLKLGDENKNVYELQRNLVSLNFLRGIPNGFFGVDTKEAVEFFQKAYNLPVTGVVDDSTWDSIDIALNNPPTANQPTLKLGDKNDAVITLKQKLIILNYLNDQADDNFDEQTKQAVMELQEITGITPDGVVGPTTWRKLDELFSATNTNIPTIKPTIKENDKNNYVKLLKNQLTAYGYYDGESNDVFDAATTNAVIRFQETYNLKPNGVVDYYTWDVLDSLSGSDIVYTPILKEGSTAPEVTILQDKLKILGLFPGTVTGSFGPSTTLAVKQFQKDNNLPETGVTDYDTWVALTNETAPTPLTRVTTTSVVNRPNLTYGDENNYVKELQRQLKQLMFYNRNITGVFDKDTLDSVKAFQTNNKLTANGIVNKDTWSALIYLYSPLAICTNTGEEFVYTVEKGDTLYSIAQKYNTTVDKIKEANNLTSNTLSIGQSLIIPGIEIEKPTPSPNYYTVQRGDTLYSIANRFGLTVDQLKRLNNLTNNTISIGQQLLISEEEEPEIEEYINYSVQRGDTLYSIASKFNTTVNNIKKLNNLTSNTITVGQNLKIPVTTPGEITVYVVQRGDTLWKIANRFNTTVDNIRTLNNLTSDTLSIGQQLKIKTP